MLFETIFMTLFKTIIMFILIIIISNCSQLGGSTANSGHSTNSPYTLPAKAFLAMAENQTGEEKESLLLMAASRYLHEGQSQEASSILAQINPLSLVQTYQKNILLAKIELLHGKSNQALSRLASIHDLKILMPNTQVEYHEALASVYQARGELIQAINEQIKVDHILQDKARITENRRKLWLRLMKLPEAELSTVAMESSAGSEIKGWMDLALIARQESEDQEKLLFKIEQWQQTYTNHPANTLLPSSLAAIRESLSHSPRQIALLLPLSGSLSGPGNAVKDGFMAAANQNATYPRKTIRVYDTASEDIVSLYQRALAEGAEYIVGPLTKNEATKLASINHPVPTLLLNDMNARIGLNAYKFGLSPTNEARQVAIKASQKGLRKALIIAPSGEWSNDIVTAFTNQWQRVGGNVVESLRFENDTDLSPAIRDFLQVSEKEAQEKQIRPVPGQPLPVIEKRRQDFDMIFLLAYPSKARQIMPLLKYYFASDIPVYATSTVYAGNTNTLRDRDLDGIIFCDMPWVFANQVPNKNWPEQFNSYNRLYAIGRDSFVVSKQLNQLLLFPAMGINNNTGILYLNRAQRIGRVLAWGRFRDGVAQKIEETT